MFGKRAKADPDDFENKQSLAQTLYYDATCALQSGDKDGADKGYHECLKICEELATEPKTKGPQTDLLVALPAAVIMPGREDRQCTCRRAPRR